MTNPKRTALSVLPKCKADLLGLVRRLLPRQGQGSRDAPDQLRRSFEVRSALEPGPQRPEQGIIVEPVPVIMAESIEQRPQVRAPAGAEFDPGSREQPMLERGDRS